MWLRIEVCLERAGGDKYDQITSLIRDIIKISSYVFLIIFFQDPVIRFLILHFASQQVVTAMVE